MAGRGWYDRGYLPHLEISSRAVGVTFRLADSLPQHVLKKWKAETRDLAEAEARMEIARKVAAYEDAGRGASWLALPRCAEVMVSALRHFDGERYTLLEWCVMPNHVHVLIVLKTGHGYRDVVRSWKNFTARRINAIVGRTGRLWASDFYDRLIRDQEHLAKARRYIRMNPVKAGLCKEPEEWRWGSSWTGGCDGERA